ncbi:MAG: porin [Rhodocyclales bacterium]|nr:porin [Rhodocyclales bacterium]MBI5785574.1 porin [Rhodocyclales bacterium]
MQDKLSLTRPRLLAAAIAGLLAAAAVPALADAETDALRRELAEQRKLIEKLLADREADKKAAPVAAAPAAAAPAPAAVTSTPGVRIYGILDGGIEHLTNVRDTTNTTQGSLTRMPSITATLPSRVGIAGTKDLGDGYKGIATAEIGFNTDDGTLGQGGRLFGRQLFAGVETPFGAMTYGRQWSMLLYAMMGSDLLGPNIYALGSMDPYLASMRYDNSVAWRAKFGGFSAGALYSTGRSVVANGGAPAAGNCAGEIAGTNQCRGWSVMAGYADPAWGVSGAVDEQRGGNGAAAPFFNGSAPIPFTRAADKDRRTNLGGYVKFGPAKVGAGWLGRKVDAAAGTTKSDAYYLTAAYTLTDKVTIDGGWNRMTNDDQDRNANLYVLRGFYSLDKALVAYLQMGHIANSELASYALSVGPNVAPPAGGSQTGTMAGLRYMF